MNLRLIRPRRQTRKVYKSNEIHMLTMEVQMTTSLMTKVNIQTIVMMLWKNAFMGWKKRLPSSLQTSMIWHCIPS